MTVLRKSVNLNTIIINLQGWRYQAANNLTPTLIQTRDNEQ